MQATYQIADLTLLVEASIEELVKAQGVEREFDRACRKIREVAGESVTIRIDENLESDEGREFSKIRLRATDQSRNYTIDCGTTENNVLGIYVDWDAPVEVYNRKDGSSREARPFRESTAQSGTQSDEPSLEPPAPELGENGRLKRESALQLWRAAKDAGHTKKSFAKMLASVAGVKKPQLVTGADWPQAWEYAVDPATWKMEEKAAGEQELPLE